MSHYLCHADHKSRGKSAILQGAVRLCLIIFVVSSKTEMSIAVYNLPCLRRYIDRLAKIRLFSLHQNTAFDNLQYITRILIRTQGISYQTLISKHYSHSKLSQGICCYMILEILLAEIIIFLPSAGPLPDMRKQGPKPVPEIFAHSLRYKGIRHQKVISIHEYE